MAYDAAKAHEYYENYTKKGKKKGRKKGKKKTSAKTTRIIGLTTAGLNDAGKMEVALVKEKLQAEMNAALKGAKNQAEKDAIRKEYQNKALQEIRNIRSKSEFAKEKTTSSKGSSKAAGGSSKSNGGSKSSGGSSSGSSKSSVRTSASTGTTATSGTDTAAKIESIQSTLTDLVSAVKNISDDKKTLVKETVSRIIEQLKSIKSFDASNIIKGLENMS